MARKTETQSKGIGRLRRVASAVKRVFTRGRGEASQQAVAPAPAAARKSRAAAPAAARPARREADIPMDMIENVYTPPMTSTKASFRSDGSDRQQDQELTPGTADDRWNDEDHYTNKSGDPRIGTHRRQYEPGETRAESRE